MQAFLCNMVLLLTPPPPPRPTHTLKWNSGCCPRADVCGPAVIGQAKAEFPDDPAIVKEEKLLQQRVEKQKQKDMYKRMMQGLSK